MIVSTVFFLPTGHSSIFHHRKIGLNSTQCIFNNFLKNKCMNLLQKKQQRILQHFED